MVDFWIIRGSERQVGRMLKQSSVGGVFVGPHLVLPYLQKENSRFRTGEINACLDRCGNLYYQKQSDRPG